MNPNLDLYKASRVVLATDAHSGLPVSIFRIVRNVRRISREQVDFFRGNILFHGGSVIVGCALPIGEIPTLETKWSLIIT